MKMKSGTAIITSRVITPKVLTTISSNTALKLPKPIKPKNIPKPIKVKAIGNPRIIDAMIIPSIIIPK